MLFEWDECKRHANLAKHHIDFRDAKRMFDGPVFERIDRRHGEDRIFALGLMEDIEMKGKSTRAGSGARAKGKTDFRRLREMRDEEIDYSDIPKLDKSFWKKAKLSMPEPKDRLTIRVDHDVVEWLKKKGSGYQTRINAILRSYMKAQSEEGADSRT
jgi:uncharacterized protein (DUF4415 family)